MMSEIALCLDSESVRAPELIGLDGENLVSQPWLYLWTDATEARERIRSNDVLREVWVVSSDDMDSINLAAAIKRDEPNRIVCLVAFTGGGSLRSRAAAAGIDAVFSRTVFIRRYAQQKAEHLMGKGDKADEQSLEQSLKATPEKTPEQALECGADEQSKVEQKAAHRSLGDAYHFADSEQTPVQASDGADEGACEKTAAQQEACEQEAHEQEACEQRESEQTACEQTDTQSPEKSSDTQTTKSLRAVASIPIVKRNNFLIAVVGAAGGVGKSAVSGLTAYFAQGFGLRTLLIDADFQFGDMHHLAGIERPLTIDEARNDARLLAGLRSCGSAPAVLAAPSRLEYSEELSGAVSSVLDAVHEGFDVVVANTGAHWGEMQARLLEQANLVIFLVDQRASALRKARHAIELCGRCGIPTNSFVVAVNRCSRNALINSFDASCSLGGLRAIELRDGGREVDELLGAGLPLELIASGNEFCVSLEHFLVDVLPRKEGSLLAEASELAKNQKSKRRRRRGKRSAACL